MKEGIQRLCFQSRGDFRSWLQANAESNEGIWLILGKRGAIATLSATEALEEALCFGWIDGQVQSIDDDSYLKYFKQRARSSNWSERNKRIVERLEDEGLMTDFGRMKIESAKRSGIWDADKRIEPMTDELLQRFYDMVRPFEPAFTNLMGFPLATRRNYARSYFFGAKTEEGMQRQFDRIIERLNLNLDPMRSMRKTLEIQSDDLSR